MGFYTGVYYSGTRQASQAAFSVSSNVRRVTCAIFMSEIMVAKMNRGNSSLPNRRLRSLHGGLMPRRLKSTSRYLIVCPHSSNQNTSRYTLKPRRPIGPRAGVLLIDAQILAVYDRM